jgi:hypothetical protein
VDTRISSIENTSLTNAADQLEEVNGWLRAHSRDVLDESDELLHVKYQLVYSSGAQRHLDAAPDRWTNTQQVLDVVSRVFPDLHSSHPRVAHHYPRGAGAFSEIRLLETSDTKRVAQELQQSIADAALAGDIQNLNLTHISSPCDRELVINFLTVRDVSSSITSKVQKLCAGSWKGILLLRGLLAFDVLQHVLTEKLYRVNYGLDLKRSQLAVPYAAKVCHSGLPLEQY